MGSGSGYTTHLLAEAIGSEGIVVGMEHIKRLCDIGEANMRKTERGRELRDKGNVVFVAADARKGLTSKMRKGIKGIDSKTKWDVIHVAACAPEVPPALLEQLQSPGW